ncbi:MAG TPA: hypothetical protein VFD84_04660 [Candidatus Binatia bacterium]|nr:hypothetical protein [Candidatus Binatia bacterium]
MRAPRRVFLLSPAHCGGERAQMLLAERARFDLAVRVRSPAGAPIGEVFAFLSGLYFRGKLAYAGTFARPSDVLVITPGAGLVPPETPVTGAALSAFAAIDVATDAVRFRAPLAASAARLADRLGPRGEVVLLGSIASGKYVDPLAAVFGPRLVFPEAFVGRGDMSRGGLLLRCARAREELTYVPVVGAVRRGTRPPRLAPLGQRAAASRRR